MRTLLAPPTHDYLPAGPMLEQLLAQLPVGVMICNDDGSLLYVNGAARRLRDEMRAAPLLPGSGDALPPYERLERLLASTLLTGEPVRGELVPFLGPDAEAGWLAVTATPVREGHGITGCVLTFSDATARRRLRELTPIIDTLRRL